MTRLASLRLPKLTLDQPRAMVNVLAIVAAAMIAGIALFVDGGRASGTSVTDLAALPAPVPPPLLLRDVSPQDAVSLNQRIPFTIDQNFAAKPFHFRGDEGARARALECLTMAVYYEAGSQDAAGKEAVAQVVLNRVRHPAFPSSVCGVVFQGYERKTGCQFTFTCDGSLLRAPDRKVWAEAQQVADQALSGAVFMPVGLATFYHADYVVPYWATSLAKNAQVGVHIFYRWPQAWGMPAAFLRRYSGDELDPANLKTAALMGHGRWLALSNPESAPVDVAPDARVELLAVVQLLAKDGTAARDDDTQYEKDIKTYFAAEADHPAVQQFRKLSEGDKGFAASATDLVLNLSPPPDLTRSKEPAAPDKTLSEFVDSLRDFARHSEFQRFFAGHKPYYSRLIRSSQAVGIVSAQWQAYTGMTLEGRKLIVSSLLQTPLTNDACGPARHSAAVLSVAALTTSNKAEAFLGIGDRGSVFAAPRNAPPVNPAVQEQIVRAVFSRIAALTAGDEAGREAIRQETKLGNKLVPVFDERLRYFEIHRAEFPTLADFLPQLLKDLPKAETSDKAARRCAPTTVASAEIAPQTPSGGL